MLLKLLKYKFIKTHNKNCEFFYFYIKDLI